MFSPGAQDPLRLNPVVGGFHLLVSTGQSFPFSCWLLPRGSSQLLEAALRTQSQICLTFDPVDHFLFPRTMSLLGYQDTVLIFLPPPSIRLILVCWMLAFLQSINIIKCFRAQSLVLFSSCSILTALVKSSRLMALNTSLLCARA